MKKIFLRQIKENILKTIDEKPITIIYGPRQVGKTTLVKEISKTFEKVRYFQCDDPLDRESLENKGILEISKLISGYDLIIIDEAQRIPNIGTTLKLIADGITGARIIATGSSSFELANKVNEPLTGRNRKYNLFGLSAGEITEAYGEIDTQRSLETFLRYGSYPAVVTQETYEQKERELKTLAEDYLFRDVLLFDGIRNNGLFEKLIKLLALQIGSEISYTKLSKELGVSRDTVYNYITILEKSFIIFRITPYYTNKIKEITKTHKIYFYDNGIRNAVIRNFTDLSTRTDTGALFENYIFSEIQKIKLYGNGNYELNFWRTHNDSEVDIIKSFGDGKIEGIECKWNKEINPPLSFQKSYPNASFTCITKDNFLDFLINQNLQQKNQ